MKALPRPNRIAQAVSATLLSCLLFPVSAAEVKADNAEEKNESDILNFEEIVVTGTPKGVSKMDASYSITSLNEETIQSLAPLNTADLIGLTPGIFTESTGGEVQNVIRIRAIPNEGSFTSFQEDGLPAMGYPQGFFVGADVVQRVDIMTESFEVVRGGPTPVFSDNAIAMFNNISRRGDETEEAAIRTTLGTIGLARVDGFWSGPVSNDTKFAIGGFLRVSDGYRDNGYTADKGGQLRFNLTHELESGGTFNFYGRYLNDRNAFYLPVPLRNSATGESLSHLLDPLDGTMNTPYLQGVNLITSDGAGGRETEDRDLSDGRHIEVKALGLEYSKQLNDTWFFSNKMRYSDITLSFDALYSGADPGSATEFADSFLDAATNAFGDAVASLDYRFVTDGSAFDPLSTDGLILQGTYRAIDNELFTFVNDTRVTGQLGAHEVTFGALLSHYGEDASRRYMNYLFEMRSNPQPVDLLAFDAAGNVVGSVTQDGVLRQGSLAQAFKQEAYNVSLYANDNWQLTEALRLEAGLRYQYTDFRGGRWGQETVDLGDPTTLADDAVMGITGVFNPTGNVSNNNLSWTLGANYQIHDDLGVYSRVSRSFSLGELFVQSGGNTDETEVTQYEMGVKYDGDVISVFATAFYIEFEPIIENLETITLSGETVIERFQGSATSPGLELLAVYTPFDNWSFTANLAFTNSELNDLQSLTAGSTAVAPDGNSLRRQPDSYGYLATDYAFKVAGADANASLRYNFVDDRFVDFNNTTVLPAYETLTAVVSLDWYDWQVQLSVDNLTDEVGLTEGNPRRDAVTGQGAPEPNYGRPIFGRTAQLTVTHNF